MSDQTRLELIRGIEDARKSRLVAYILSDRENLLAPVNWPDVRPVFDAVREMDFADRKKLDVFIYSRGGNSDVPWSMISTLRQVIGKDAELCVLVPYHAHSAATVMCLGSDEIIMGPKGELSPIDITLNSGPYNPVSAKGDQPLPVGVEDVSGYFALLKKMGCVRPEEVLKGFEILEGKIHPIVLGQVYRFLEQTRAVALKLLRSRRNALPDHDNERIMQKLSSESFSHMHMVCRDEARDDIGISFVKDAEPTGVANQMWDLYLQYETLLELTSPFRPNEYFEANPSVMEHTWQSLRTGVIETTSSHFELSQDVKVRRIKAIPPTLNLSLGQIGLPPLTLPPGIDPGQVNQVVAQFLQQVLPNILQNVVNNAVMTLLASMPDKGYNTMLLMKEWKKIT